MEKPLCSIRLRQDHLHVLRVAAIGAGYKRGAVHDRRGDRVEGRFDASEGRALRLHAFATVGRNLAGGESVDLVVHHQVGQVDVAARRVGQVVAADAIAIPVASRADHGQAVIGHLDAGSNRQKAAVEGMHAVGVEIAGKVRRAADAAYDAHVMGLNPHLRRHFLKAGENTKVPTTWTPVRVNFALKVFRCELN